MTNKWIEHVKTFAENNNIPYGCALSHPEVKNGYIKVIKKTTDERKQMIQKQTAIYFKNRIKNELTDENKPMLRHKFDTYSKGIQDILKNDYKKYYNKLYND